MRRKTAKPVCINFYPRPPRGGRLGTVPDAHAFCNISIHALRGEGDRAFRARELRCCEISIHALRGEGDRIAQRKDDLAGNFYPRPPRGGRPNMHKMAL